MTPDDFERHTGVGQKRLRSYLRSRWPHEKGAPWVLTRAMIEDACRHFGVRPPGNRMAAARTSTNAPQRPKEHSAAPAPARHAEELLAAGGLTSAGRHRWGEQIGLDRPGVYIVTTDRRYELDEVPLDDNLISKLLYIRPELRVDGHRPTVAGLKSRLARMWLPDADVVYVGLAGRSVRSRIDQYYRTPLGARAPHAGGWPIKLLSVLDRCTIHVAATASSVSAESQLIAAFQQSAHPPADFVDPTCVLPYANLTVPGGRRQRHGITGARALR